MESRTQFTDKEIRTLSPMEKIALIAVKNGEGSLHMSLLTSLMPRSVDKLTIGEFVHGRSKGYMQENRQVAFAMLSLQGFKSWRGRALWKGKSKEGPELESYKEMPMHRYNAYFPVHTVHYLDLVDLQGPESFGFAGVGLGSLASTVAARSFRKRIGDQILKPYGVEICKAPIGLRYLAYIGSEGWPVIIPVHNCRAVDSSKLILSGGLYKKELHQIPIGTEVTVFSAKLTLESVLVRGRFSGFNNHRAVHAATVSIDWVYNSMPPNSEQIYPPVPLEAVRSYQV